MWTWFIAAALSLALTTPALAARDIVITNDRGGSVQHHYARQYAEWQQGRRHVVAGICASACTMVLAFERTCVTPQAKLGFHQAYFGIGIKIPSASGTQYLMDRYPASVKRWIARKGGLPLYGMIWMSSAEARTLGVRAC